jgi:D-3-phosphoglycerate dehydrogenase
MTQNSARRVTLIGASKRLSSSELAPLEDAGFELVERVDLDTVADPRQLAQGISNSWATIASGEWYTRELFEMLPDLRVVARVGIGYDRVDVQAASEHGVLVFVTPEANADAVADHTLSLMLATLRQLLQLDRSVRAGHWRRDDPANDLFSATVGIIGLGSIGRRVAKRLVGFDCKLLAVEPFPDEAFCDRFRIEVTSLDRLLRRADIVTIHAPLTPETASLLGHREISLLHKRSIVVNTSRGGLLDQDALLRALQSGTIAGAGLDVFAEEPLPLDHPLTKLPNVVLTPHAAHFSLQGVAGPTASVVEGLLEIHAGRLPTRQRVLNPEALSIFTR